MSKRSFSSPADAGFFSPDRQILPARTFSAQRPLTDDVLSGLYEEFGARLYRYAVLLLADRAAAEDVVQDAFVRLVGVIDRRPNIELTFGYLATIVRNECYSSLRKRRRWQDAAPLIDRESHDATEEERMILDRAASALG
jgi:RNA polymerase sigma factor (sigma-70 family)